MTDPWAQRVVRRFAAASNLLIAGMATVVLAGDADEPRARSLRSLLRELGAVLVERVSDARLIVVLDDAPAAPPLDELRDDAVVLQVAAQPWLDPETPGTTTLRAPLLSLPRGDGGWVHVVDAEAGRAEVAGHDAALRTDAAQRLDWARRFMPLSSAGARELGARGAVTGRSIGIAMVLEPKTAVLGLLLAEADARVVYYAHPDETDAALAGVLRERGFAVHADADADPRRALAIARRFLADDLEYLLDDGSHLIRLAVDEGVDLLGATEETTSGLTPLRGRESALPFPVVAVNDARLKTGVDNRFGTGQSCVFAIADLLEVAGIAITDRPVAVVGFGPVGEGVAAHARALGCDVTVVESDPVRALLAQFAGFAVASLDEVLATASLVISATGAPHTLTAHHLASAAEGTIVAVAGGVPHEIDAEGLLERGAVATVLAPHVERFDVVTDGTRTAGPVILDRGGCINITAAEGNPIPIMDLSFAVQLAAVDLLTSTPPLAPGLHAVPDAVDTTIAQRALPAGPWPADPDPALALPATAPWRSTRFPTEDPSDS